MLVAKFNLEIVFKNYHSQKIIYVIFGPAKLHVKINTLREHILEGRKFDGKKI